MSESPHGAWFYTRDGERLGPVSFGDLRVKAVGGQLNPRLDLVWTQGMDTWQPAGEVQGIFDRRGTAETQDTVVPLAESHAEVEEEIFSERGWPGVRRRGYLFAVLLFPLIFNVAYYFAAAPLAAQFGAELAGWIVAGAAVASVLFVLYVVVQRFANLGMSRWWVLGGLVPILNLWTGYRCFACPAGYAQHKKLDGVGIFLAIVYWLLVAAALAAFALALAVLFGALGDAELQQRIREMMEEGYRQSRTVRP